jgi:lipoate-protein ligase A
MNTNHWLLLDSGPGDWAWNMSLDEALLEAALRLGRPVLRFYGWNEKAASFGYFQRYALAERLTQLRPLVRRPTGGGLVPHDRDWTYSVVFPPQHPWHDLRAAHSYRRVHTWLKAAFERLDIIVELAPTRQAAQPGSCFAGQEAADLLWLGKKIAGAAQRRNRNGLLIQGSVQAAAFSIARQDWQRAACNVAAQTEDVEWMVLDPDLPLVRKAEALARTKYCQASYNRKR